MSQNDSQAPSTSIRVAVPQRAVTGLSLPRVNPHCWPRQRRSSGEKKIDGDEVPGVTRFQHQVTGVYAMRYLYAFSLPRTTSREYEDLKGAFLGV